MNRRRFLIGAGGIGAATIGGAVLSSSVTADADSEFRVEDGDTVSVEDSRGRVDTVTIEPDLEIEWEDFDEAVGKIFTFIEANVDGQGYEPVFRATFWSTPATNDSGNGEATSGPGHTGDYDVNFANLGGDGFAITLADREGVPDYKEEIEELEDDDDVYDYKTARNTKGADSDNFVNGYFGPASHNEAFDADPEQDDDGTETTEVELRYTFVFQTVNASMLSGYLDLDDDGEGVWDTSETESRLAEANPRDSLDQVFDEEEFVDDDGSFWEDVLVEEVTTSDDGYQGNSQVVMDGAGSYPSYEDSTDAESPAENYVPAAQEYADDSPAAITGTTEFTVDVTNLDEEGSTEGSSNPDAEGAS